jgi:hypothetical protein
LSFHHVNHIGIWHARYPQSIILCLFTIPRFSRELHVGSRTLFVCQRMQGLVAVLSSESKKAAVARLLGDTASKNVARCRLLSRLECVNTTLVFFIPSSAEVELVSKESDRSRYQHCRNEACTRSSLLKETWRGPASCQTPCGTRLCGPPCYSNNTSKTKGTVITPCWHRAT